MNIKNKLHRPAVWAGIAAILAIAGLAPVGAQGPMQQRAPAGPWMNKDLSPDQRADLVVAEMTLDEKISLAHGPGGFQAAGAISNGGAGVVSPAFRGSACRRFSWPIRPWACVPPRSAAGTPRCCLRRSPGRLRGI